MQFIRPAVEGITKAFARESRGRPIRVNTICPGYIETAMTAPMLAEPALRVLAENGTALMVDGGSPLPNRSLLQ